MSFGVCFNNSCKSLECKPTEQSFFQSFHSNDYIDLVDLVYIEYWKKSFIWRLFGMECSIFLSD